jgi:hypothetical protein
LPCRNLHVWRNTSKTIPLKRSLLALPNGPFRIELTQIPQKLRVPEHGTLNYIEMSSIDPQDVYYRPPAHDIDPRHIVSTPLFVNES